MLAVEVVGGKRKERVRGETGGCGGVLSQLRLGYILLGQVFVGMAAGVLAVEVVGGRR